MLKEFFINEVLAQEVVVGGDKITNPLSCKDLSCLLDLVLSIVLTLGTPLIAVMIVYSGFLYLFAQGNEAKLTKAHTALLYTIIGAAVILGSFVIKSAIQGTITNLGT